MKSDIVMYEKVYQILKNKIECGLIPNGSRLPSRAKLCEEFATSEKTVRRAVKMLTEDGLVETAKRRRPVVVYKREISHEEALRTMQKADDTAAVDILRTGILLCYPVNRRGMSLCRESEWEIPEAIIEHMDPDKPADFWRQSNRFWRFFIARNENELILRAVDSLGFSQLDPQPGTLKIRKKYLAGLRELVQTMKTGGKPEAVHFDKLFTLYGLDSQKGADQVIYHVPLESVMISGARGLERQLRESQERCSNVYLDILGLIAVGRYQLGERLPSHKELCKIYDVSVDTTLRAIRTLTEWGVVTAQRGRGIFVALDLDGLKNLPLDPGVLSCHVRRYLDSLELLSLTVEGVAAHAAQDAQAGDVQSLHDKISRLWKGEYLYQLSPVVLLKFILDHIRYDALKTIYRVLYKNYHIGRSIPNLVKGEKNKANCEIYEKSIKAVKFLLRGEKRLFAMEAAEMFQKTQGYVISECSRLGYLEAAMNVYNGEALWK